MGYQVRQDRFKANFPFQYQNQNLICDNLDTESPLLNFPRLSSALSGWVYIVEAYTRGHLTKSSDKLVAISAIARETQPLM